MKKKLSPILCAILCAALLLPFTACSRKHPSDHNPDIAYEKLLQEYALLLKTQSEGGDPAAAESPATKGLSNDLFASLQAILPEMEYEEVSDMGYAFRDLDSDGTYECFLMKRDGTLYGLYTCIEGKPHLVENYRANGGRLAILMEDGTILTHRILRSEGKLTGDQYHYSYFKNGGMETYLSYFTDYTADEAYAVENGERRELVEGEYFSNQEKINALQKAYSVITKKSGLRFKSALTDNSQPSPTAPELDLSDYDAILSTLTAMMPTIRAFSENEWRVGAYDHLMKVDSDEEFQLYNHLLFACGSQNDSITGDEVHLNTFGYAYKDLNKDGRDELIIMTENDKLLAIFTQKDGVPVLLWRRGYDLSVRLDENNRLLVMSYPNFDWSSNEYTAFELTSEGEFKKTACLYIDNHVRKMLSDGKMVFIDSDTYEAEYKRAFNISTRPWQNDWNQDDKILNFTALQ